MEFGNKKFIIQLERERTDLRPKFLVAMDSSNSSIEQLKCNEIVFLDESLNDSDAAHDGDSNNDYYECDDDDGDDDDDRPECFIEGEEVDLSQSDDGIDGIEFTADLDDIEEPYQDSDGALYYICEKCTFVCINHATLVQHTNENHPKNQPPQRPRNNNSALRSSGTGIFSDDSVRSKGTTLGQKQVTPTKSLLSPVKRSLPVQPVFSPPPLQPLSLAPSPTLTLSSALIEDLKPYECKICHKRLSTKANLRGHLTTHSNEKPFACHLCAKRFKQKRHLKYHQKIHNFKSLSIESGQSIMDSYDELSGLQFAENDESNESYEFDHESAAAAVESKSKGNENHKPTVVFQCNLCPKVYAQKRSLYRHQRTHTPIYPCEICQKKFKIEENLHEHLKAHAAEQ